MPRPLAGLLLFPLALAAACAAPHAITPARPPAASPPARRGAAVTGPARYFQGLPEESFWVSHDAALDRVIAGGARLELLPSGQLSSAAWDHDLASRGEVAVGSVAVSKSQGGGFVHWSRTRVFRSQEFTGELEPVIAGDNGIRGARPGWRSVLVSTESGPRELLPGSHTLTPLAEPGLYDAAASDASHAIRLDVFGRASSSIDGGKSWLDLSPSAGIAVRGISLGEHELLLETWQGRFAVGQDGKIATLESSQGRSYYDQSRGFQIAWKGTRAADREEWPTGYREATPLQAAVFAGAEIGDGTGVGVIQGVTVRVDLATGKLVSLASDWIPGGLQCQPIRADDGVLFACAWERYQGYGGYLLRSTAGGAPEVERAFTDDGGFVADDDGALGYTGSCRVDPKLFDPEDMARGEYESEPTLKPVFCVRKSDGGAPEWVERSLDVGPGATLIAWVPRKDGTATALVLSNEPLPERSRGATRVSEQGGVRVIRVYREIESFAFSRTTASQFAGRGLSSGIDKRFAARADGSIDAWLSPSQDNYQPIQIGVTIATDGRLTVHEMPPGASVMTVTGDYGVAMSARGDLHETLDHGRTWRAAGTSPVPASAFSSGGGCSALGCVLGPVVRLGWGEGKLAIKINLMPMSPLPSAAESAPSAPRLVCSPAGGPGPVAPPAAAPAGTKQVVSTSYGDTLEIVRDQAVPEPTPPNQGFPPGLPMPPGMLPPSPTASASVTPATSAAAGKPKSAPAVLRTHSLLWRPPFDPTAPLRRLNATDASFNVQRRSLVTPLLGSPGEGGKAGDAGAEVSLLLAGDTTELLISSDKITSSPSFEARRYYYGEAAVSSGLRLPGGHALLLGEVRRRLTIEEHGASPPPPPFYLGVDREQFRRRPMTLGRRDDGAAGVLIFDGGAPETVGVAEIDRAGAAVLAVHKLAPWSSAITADDPRCRSDGAAYRALVVLDPSLWFEIDPVALPGVTLARQGMALVRWGKERVCIEAIDAAVSDLRRKADGTRTWSLVARWGGKGSGGPRGGKSAALAGNAALRSSDLRQELRCAVQPRVIKP